MPPPNWTPSLLLQAMAGLTFNTLRARADDNVAADNSKCAADYFVRSLPGQPEGPLPKMHAGHIEVDPKIKGNLFFWHVANNHIDIRPRTVIWLNGGPGCSSMDGALMEVGPFRVKDSETLIHNPGSWHEFANLLFVDQPVGTGFSYVNSDGYLHELDEMANHFVIFLEKFFAIFPEHESDQIYFAGESFAGQHIPYIAKAILERNKKNKGVRWDISGLLIGNGWIDPKVQYPAYVEFAYKHNLMKQGSDIAKKVEAQLAICLARIEQEGSHTEIGPCEEILQELLRSTIVEENGVSKCYNMYDVRLKDFYPACGSNWPPDLKNMTPYLRREDVRLALHVNPDKKSGWTECAGSVSGTFKARNSKPSVELLPDLLKEMPIMLFSGEEDLICNHIGTENLIHNMTWNGGTGFETSPGNWAPRTEWEFEGKKAGYYQEARNLTYVLIHESSHMVPFDLPRQSRDLLDKFVGVDITSIGGPPAKSKVGGQELPPTSVGATNTTVKVEKEKLDEARWSAYYRSGEIALVFVTIAAIAWGYFVWRQRRNRASRPTGPAYAHVAGSKRAADRADADADIERGGFDESELDELHVATPVFDADGHDDNHYSIGDDSDDEDVVAGKKKAQQ